MTNRTQQTVRELTPALGATVLVRFEDLTIECNVADVKNSWGKVRLLVEPLAGKGQQWVELGRLVQADLLYACDACARDIKFGGVSDDEGRLVLTGKFGRYDHHGCALCGASTSTHEVKHAR